MASKSAGAGVAIAVALIAWATRTRVTSPVVGPAQPGGAGAGPERPLRRTGGTPGDAWYQSRLSAAAMALRRAAAEGLFTVPDAIAPQVATLLPLAMTAHWALETGSGAAEHGWNVGNIRAFPDRRDSHVWHRWTDGLPYRDYDSLADGAYDYVRLVLGNAGYRRAVDALLRAAAAGQTRVAGDYAVALAQAGYSGLRGGADQRRREVDALAARVARAVLPRFGITPPPAPATPAQADDEQAVRALYELPAGAFESLTEWA